MTYDSIKELVEGKSLPLMGCNENGEVVLVQAGVNEVGRYYQTDTSQDNGWLRTNVYYEDGTYEELYSK